MAWRRLLPAGSRFRLALFLINGDRPGPTLVVTGGVHAAEYASIAAALEFGRSLQPQGLAGRVIVLPVMNVPGFGVRSIYTCPLDGTNLNRMFPGKADGSGTEQLAEWVFRNVISQATHYVDLHGGDLIEALVPFTIFYRSGNAKVDRVSREMGQVFGIRYLVRSETSGSTYSAASQAGIPAILTEAGGQGIWTAEHVALHVQGLGRLLRYLGMTPGPAPAPLAEHAAWTDSSGCAARLESRSGIRRRGWRRGAAGTGARTGARLRRQPAAVRGFACRRGGALPGHVTGDQQG